jgi:bacillithiol biosynthesis cysteine-adding enzyme BshC
MEFLRRRKKLPMLSLEPSQYLKGLPLDYVTSLKVTSYFAKDYRKIVSRENAISDDVIDRIEKYNKKIGACSKVSENIKRLKETPPIVTGQQPCLLTGPLFVIYKAMTAIILAEKYETVPVFWNASEDDDISEVNHIWALNSDLERISLELEFRPFSKIRIKREDIEYVVDRLRILTPETEFREEILSILTKCPLAFSEMFSHLLSALFADYGLIVVEPHIFADLLTPLYRKLIEHPTEAVTMVNHAGDVLEEKGYKRQIHKSDESCSFYLVLNDRRHAVTYDGRFWADNNQFTTEELLDLLHAHPEQFSSTVISRPLVQDFLFSSLAYCAGPGEISYFAQMKAVYGFFGIEEPPIVPRFGATIVEKKVQKVLDKYDITISDISDPDKVLKTLVRRDISEFFDTHREEVMKTLRDIEDFMTAIDGNLEKASKAMRVHISKDLKALEQKTSVSLKRQNQISENQIMKASANLFPRQMLQERVLNIFQYIIRYRSFVEILHTTFQNAQPGQHLIVQLGD